MAEGRERSPFRAVGRAVHQGQTLSDHSLLPHWCPSCEPQCPLLSPTRSPKPSAPPSTGSGSFWMCFLPCRPGPKACPSSHSHPLPLPLSGPLIFLGPIDSTSVYLSWNLSSPLYSHCPCLRSSAKVEQWLKAQVQSQPQVRIPHLPLTSW